jgi:gliding motility-associated-like protein
MKNLKAYLFTAGMILAFSGFGQQLILDGSVEGGPGGTGTVPPDWTLVQATPDNCESPPGACPGPSYVINNPSPDGGRWIRFFRGGGHNERFGQYICQPLVAGQTYTLEFWASHSDLNSSANATNTGIDYGFSIGLPGGAGAGAGNAGAVALTTPEVWQLVSVTFVAAGNYDFISFAKNTTDTQNATYIDGVSLVGTVPPAGADPGTNGTISVCPSDPVFNLFDQLGGTPDTGGTWTGPSAVGGGHLGTYNPGANTPGVYTYEVTGTSPCAGTTTASATVTVTAGSADATITAAGPFCDNDAAINLTAADPGGTWTGTGITNGATGTFDPGVAGPGTHTITYNITGACSDTDTEDIIVNPSADATITAVGPFCITDASITLTAVDGGGSWSGNGITNAATGEFDPGTAGAGTHTITYTIGGACGDVQTTNIVVNGQSDATITPAGPFCDTDPALNLVGADPGGTWSGNGITNATTGEFNPATAGTGTHTITYTIPGGCGDTQTENIIVNGVADATITPAGPFCSDDAAVNLVGADPGGTWTGIGITNAAAGTFDPLTAGAGTHTITYTIGGVCGDAQTTDIIVNQVADATITPAGPFCSNDPAVTLVGADPGGTWSGLGITNPTTGDFDPAAAGGGTHTITYTIGGVCGDVQTTTITVNPLADATINAAGPFCDTDAGLNLLAADPGGTWAGAGITDINTGTFDPSVAGAGTHTITYTIAGACGATDTEDILVNPTDDPTVNPAGPFCQDGAVATITAVTAGGTWSGTGITNTATGEFTPTTAGAGTHTITYTTAGVCPSTGTVNIDVLPPLDVTALQNMTICEGESATLTAQGSGGDANLLINWTDDLGAAVGTGGSITVSPIATTSYTATVTDGCGTLPASDQVTVTVTPLPQINFTASEFAGCVPFSVTFPNSTVPGGTSCTWDFGDGVTSNLCGDGSHTYASAGCYDVTLTVSEGNCTSTMTMPSLVCVYDYAEAEFMASSNQVDVENTIVEFENLSTNANVYEWTFEDGSTSPNENALHQFPAEIGNYSVCLKAMNDGMCNDSTCQVITVTEQLIFYVPNAFTPDGDQFNEQLLPVFTSGFDIYDFHFTIFNRWGEIIWESYNSSVGWDGHYGDGGLVHDGVYVWQVEFKSNQSDERQTHRGHVTVLK